MAPQTDSGIRALDAVVVQTILDVLVAHVGQQPRQHHGTVVVVVKRLEHPVNFVGAFNGFAVVAYSLSNAAHVLP